MTLVSSVIFILCFVRNYISLLLFDAGLWNGQLSSEKKNGIILFKYVRGYFIKEKYELNKIEWT